MARKPDPLRDQIKRLEAALMADGAERRAAEAPLRAARRPLADTLRKCRTRVHEANQALADELHLRVVTGGFYGHMVDHYEARLRNWLVAFDSALTTLQTFDALHNIEADYEPAPRLDREATIAAARVEREQTMAAVRARARTFIRKDTTHETP